MTDAGAPAPVLTAADAAAPTPAMADAPVPTAASVPPAPAPGVIGPIPKSLGPNPSGPAESTSDIIVAVAPEDKETIPPHERSDLIMNRIHHYRDTIRGYQVQIDGEFVGRVKDDQSETYTLRPGTYEVRLRLLWIFSPVVEIVLAPAGETHMVCGPNGGILQAWRLFVAPTTAIFLRHGQKPGGDAS